jgi:DNA-3-methyladenine glycosylase
MRLPKSFYLRDDVVKIAEDLLGKCLFTNIGGVICGGIISETEAYAGITDKASHAYGDRRTLRTEVMYAEGGISYVYLCYGIHALFNVVTNIRNVPHAVLIRGIFPIKGIEEICVRTNKKSARSICDGPGKLTKSLGINVAHNNLSLSGEVVWIEDRNIDLNNYNIKCNPRIGIDYAGEDAKLPYRFNLVK